MHLNWKKLFDQYEHGLNESLINEISSSSNEKEKNYLMVYASKQGHKQIVQLLIEKKANIDFQNRDGFSSLMLACERGNLEMTEFLVNQGADLELMNHVGSTALCVACEYGFKDIASFLIAKGANMDHLNKNGESPLILAYQNGHDEIIELLVLLGANINIRSDLKSLLYLICVIDDDYQIGQVVICDEIKTKIPWKLLFQMQVEQICRKNNYDEVVKTLLIQQANEFVVNNDIANLLKIIDDLMSYFQTYDISIILRNFLIQSLYFDFTEADLNQKVLDSIDKSDAFLINSNHCKIFKSMDLNATSDNLGELREKQILDYFSTSDFQHKLFENVIKNLNNHKEFLKIEKEKLLESFPSFCSKIKNVTMSKNVKYTRLIQTINSIGLTNLINQSQTNQERNDLFALFMNNLNKFILNIDELLKYASDLYNLLTTNKMVCYLRSKFYTNNITNNIPSLNQKPVNSKKVIKRRNSALEINTPLLIALENNRMELSKYFIKKRIYINETGKHGQTPLIKVVQKGKLALVQLLIENGADLKNTNGENALSVACSLGFESIVDILIQNGAFIDIKNKEALRCLFIACQKGFKHIIELFVSHHLINVNTLDADKNTFLLIACKNNHEDLAKFLIEQGSNVNLENMDGESPLLLACQNGSKSISKCLIDNGAHINTNYLLLSCQKGHQDIVDLLIKKGVYIDALGPNGTTPLSIACEYKQIEIVEMLIRHNVYINIHDNYGRTPLYMACLAGEKKIVELLVKNGANIDSTDEDGVSPLLLTCKYSLIEIMEYLIQNGANVNILDNDEQTPLFHACQFGKRDIAELLIKNGALIDTQDNEGESPLLIACRNGSIEIAKLLIDQGANLNIQDDDGESPLFLAYQSGKKELIDLLCVRLIENLYENFVNLNMENFRQKVIDSIDNKQMFIIQWGHLKAFKSIRSIEYLQELRAKNIFKYFASYAFQEKYILDLIDTLNDQKELLNIAKTKLIYHFPKLKSNNLNKSMEIKDEESNFYYSLSYSDISELITNNTLIDFVMQSTEQSKFRTAFLVFGKIKSFSQVVEKNLQLSRYLLELITQEDMLEFLNFK